MNKKLPLILAVDTSCDDTSASVMQGQTVLSNVIASQTQLHKKYGGVFPTVAKQAHKENIKPTIKEALRLAGAVLDRDIDAFAVTLGPGLAPSLEIGIAYMKELSLKTDLPLIPVNHIEGHILSCLAKPKKRVSNQEISITEPQLPALAIVVSGGHTEFVLVKNIGEYEILGSTIDDAAGEALDKIGRMINLGYPAGALIEKLAKKGNPLRFKFPLPMTQTKDFNMSFSGLKTFAKNFLRNNYPAGLPDKQTVYDFCASAQYAIFRHITYKLEKVLEDNLLQVENYQIKEVWLGGGVACNVNLKASIRSVLKKFEKNTNIVEDLKNSKQLNRKNDTQAVVKKIKFRSPYTKRLCMDNGAMIGLVAFYKHSNNENIYLGKEKIDQLERKPRWEV